MLRWVLDIQLIKALPDFIDTYGFSDIPKHQYMEYVKDAKSDWHDEAVSILKKQYKRPIRTNDKLIRRNRLA